MNCDTCKDRRPDPVPYIVHEGDMARMERENKRAWILCIILCIALVVSWIGFAVYESQYETVTETNQEVWQDTDSGDNRFIGGDYNG